MNKHQVAGIPRTYAIRPVQRWYAVLLCGLILLAPIESLRAEEGEASVIARIEGPQSPYRQGMDALTLQEVMQRWRVPGVSIAVVRDFKVDWAKAYGIADVQAGKPVNVDTLFQAASLSKAITAMAVLRLVQNHRISLDEDINKYLKSWRIPESEFTRRQPVTPRWSSFNCC
jgi:CubicO group peptidase (beta-lactamase class C family)